MLSGRVDTRVPSPVPTSPNRDLMAVISLRHAEPTSARAWSTSSSLPFRPPFWCRSPPKHPLVGGGHRPPPTNPDQKGRYDDEPQPVQRSEHHRGVLGARRRRRQ